MSTPASYYVDVVFEAVPSRLAFESVMNGVFWAPWLTPADVAGPDDNRQVGFDPVRIVEKWIDNTCYLRVTQREWDDLIAVGRPAAFEITHELDPFAPLSFVDQDNPTEAEFNASNIWYQISLDDAAVAKVRKARPEEVDELDENGDPTGGTVKQGLRFGAFDTRQDFRGVNEPA